MAAPVGNTNRAGAAAITRVLMEQVRAERFDLLRKGVRAQLVKASEGDLSSLTWIYNRIAGLPRAELEVSASDARELDMASVVSLILQHRKSNAVDALQQVEDSQQIEAPASDPCDPPTPG